jgi:hypothetical protein
LNRQNWKKITDKDKLNNNTQKGSSAQPISFDDDDDDENDKLNNNTQKRSLDYEKAFTY